MKLILKLLVFVQILTRISALLNITCGCINYDLNNIRCYQTITTCVNRYLGSGVYATNVLFADTILPQLIDNTLNCSQKSYWPKIASLNYKI